MLTVLLAFDQAFHLMSNPSLSCLELLLALWACDIHHLHIPLAFLAQFLKPFFFHDPFFFLNEASIDLNAFEYALFRGLAFRFGLVTAVTAGGLESKAVNLALSTKSSPEPLPNSFICSCMASAPAISPSL
jgi:hypothetical protein